MTFLHSWKMPTWVSLSRENLLLTIPGCFFGFFPVISSRPHCELYPCELFDGFVISVSRPGLPNGPPWVTFGDACGICEDNLHGLGLRMVLGSLKRSFWAPGGTDIGTL